jgi:hypothetical protein
MPSFKNVTDEDLEVVVDGRRIFVGAGGKFDVADEFVSTLASQTAFEPADKATTSAVAENLASFEVEPEPAAPAEAPKAKASAEAPTEGDN